MQIPHPDSPFAAFYGTDLLHELHLPAKGIAGDEGGPLPSHGSNSKFIESRLAAKRESEFTVSEIATGMPPSLVDVYA